MRSPYPPFAESVMKTKPKMQNYKGEDYHVVEIYWYDSVTNHTFDTEQTSQVILSQVLNEYRVKHGLPFPDELVQLRNRIGLSSQKMGTILGLGVNQYKLYEKGAMPVEAVGRYMKMLVRNKSALLDCLNSSRNKLTDEEYNNAIDALKNREPNVFLNQFLKNRDKNNGYALLDDTRLQNVILHFINNMGPLCLIYLNRLLFYTDFLAYRTQTMAISGMSYKATTQGPVPTDWKYVPLIEGLNPMEKGSEVILTSDLKPNYDCFTETEVKVLNAVSDRFKHLTLNDIVEISQLEDAWIECEKDGKEYISFDNAFTLKGVTILDD